MERLKQEDEASKAEEIERIKQEEAMKAEIAAKVFEAQFDEINQKVEDAKKELELERLKRAEEKVQFEQRMALLDLERKNFE